MAGANTEKRQRVRHVRRVEEYLPPEVHEIDFFHMPNCITHGPDRFRLSSFHSVEDLMIVIGRKLVVEHI